MAPYAIIQSGGKQYRVSEGDEIELELLASDDQGKVEFSEVLFYHDGKKSSVGTPRVDGVTVVGTALGEIKGKKVISFGYKRRKNVHRKIGHRQRYTRVKIEKIGA